MYSVYVEFREWETPLVTQGRKEILICRKTTIYCTGPAVLYMMFLCTLCCCPAADYWLLASLRAQQQQSSRHWTDWRPAKRPPSLLPADSLSDRGDSRRHSSDPTLVSWCSESTPATSMRRSLIFSLDRSRKFVWRWQLLVRCFRHLLIVMIFIVLKQFLSTKIDESTPMKRLEGTKVSPDSFERIWCSWTIGGWNQNLRWVESDDIRKFQDCGHILLCKRRRLSTRLPWVWCFQSEYAFPPNPFWI